MDLKNNFSEKPNEDSIILICVIRDEILLLSYFINFYIKLGVTHFVFIDNNSNDTTIEYLCNHSFKNIKVYYTQESYAENVYGIGWVNKILNDYFRNNWCLVVDIDELIMPRHNETLTQIRERVIRVGSNILVSSLVDFYPRKLDSRVYVNGESFLNHSNHYDCMDTNFEDIFMEIQDDNAMTIKGGVRHRVVTNTNASNDSVCLTKKVFLNMIFIILCLSEGMHWLMPHQFKDWLNPENKKLWKTTNHNLRFHDEMVILAHFKYLKPNIFEHFKKRIINGEDWAGPGINGNRGKGKSQEYKEYAKYKVNSFYLEGKTKKFVNATDTYENTLETDFIFK